MSASVEYFETAFARQRVMAILRGYSPERTVELCQRAWSIGIGVVEVPIQAPEAMPSLRAAVEAGRRRGFDVGAGTVTTVEQVEAVAREGVAFTVAPGLDADVVDAGNRLGLAHLPGVATASDIQAARRLGLGWLKAFPAQQLTPGWFTAMRGPFPGVRFVATGGIDAANAAQFLAAGARIVAVGSALATEGELDQLGQLVTPTAAD